MGLISRKGSRPTLWYIKRIKVGKRKGLARTSEHLFCARLGVLVYTNRHGPPLRGRKQAHNHNLIKWIRSERAKDGGDLCETVVRKGPL